MWNPVVTTDIHCVGFGHASVPCPAVTVLGCNTGDFSLRSQCYKPQNLLEPSPQPSRLPLSCLKTIFPLSPDWIVPSHALKSGEHPNQTPSWWELWVSPCGECHSCCFQFVSVLEVMLVVFSLSPSRLLFADVNAGERVQTNSVATASASNSTWTSTKQPAAQEKSPVIWVLLSNTGHIWKEN